MPAVLFAGIVALSMCAVHPVLTAASLAGALGFSLLARGRGATLTGLRWQLPLLALVCLANPLFSASGSTLVAKLGPRSVYAESLAYGANMGALLVAVTLWLEDAAAVLDQDRLLALAGGRARTLPLLVSMTAQLVPQILGRARAIGAAQDACTAAVAAGGRRAGLRGRLLQTSGMLLAWSLEDSVGRADSIRARGWESGCARTVFRRERLTRRDGAAIAAFCALIAAAAAGAWAACARWQFYPRMGELVPGGFYLPFIALMCVPCAAWALARRRERRLA